MSLPNYLAKIKSSGIYRFVWDKSEIAGVDAEVLRLVVGYSEKGPFNTPVYIQSAAEFKNTFGDVSKKLEKRGVFFHRMALQALTAGPILALNLKKFSTEQVEAANFDVVAEYSCITPESIGITDIYNTTRFWALDPEKLQKAFDKKLKEEEQPKYISLAAADSKDTSNTIFMRGYTPKGYDVTLKSWYTSVGEEMPSYCEGYENMLVSDFFAQIYVFKGEFTPSLATSEALKKYFDVTYEESEESKDKVAKVALKPYITNAFGEKIDTLDALADDENSGFVNSYSGILLPYFKSATGSYLSLDVIFNLDNASHHMMMDFNTEALDQYDNYIEKLVTTAWTAKEGTSVLSCESLTKTSITATYEEKTWKFDEGNNTCYDPDLYKYICDESETTLTDLDSTKWGIFSVGDRFLVNDEEEGKTTIATLADIKETEEGKLTLSLITLDGKTVTDARIDGCLTKVNHSAGETCSNLVVKYFKGYTYETPKPKSTKEEDKRSWQENILNTLVDYEGIRIGLTSRVDIDYRYIVDTFEAYIQEEVHKQLAIIAKEKDNALALLNFPTAKTFQNHGTQFLDEQGNFQVKYIAQGGNKRHNPDIKFCLVSEPNGASYVSYNTPLTFSDGTVKTDVPAAAMVSNNFMEKYNSRQPYYIVAGPNYGRMVATGLVGPDFNYSRADLDVLEPMGVNVMVYVPRKGTYINSNQTAKQKPVTALSKINVRELVIYLQDEIEKLLQNYQWEFNTQTLRDTIKEKADYICQSVKANGGIYEFLNVCDESNNTDDVINNEMLVLSTSIEPGMGAGKMVQELTIYKKGGMTALIK